mgnify:CR=1 FL=1
MISQGGAGGAAGDAEYGDRQVRAIRSGDRDGVGRQNSRLPEARRRRLERGLQADQGPAVVRVFAEVLTIHALGVGVTIGLEQRRARTGEPWLKKLVAGTGYKVINKIADVKIPPNTGDFRLMARRVVANQRRAQRRRNALHDDMYAPMIATIEEWAASDDVGCIVVTGEGSGFCAGGDVKGFAARKAADAEHGEGAR